MNLPQIKSFFDQTTNTFSYVIRDPASAACAIIDSVLALDYASGRTSTAPADAIIAFIQAEQLKVEWILETHVHADHVSGASYLHETLGGRTGIGEKITQVQDIFGKVFNAGQDFRRDGSQFDRLFRDDDTFALGSLTGRVMHTPGHTPACLTYVIGDAAFVGDTLFMPDYGTARCDFPGGDARTLYRSIQKVLALPPSTRVFMCHDYKADGRDTYEYESSVAEQRANNIHVKTDICEDDFVRMRTARDATLSMPQLILPSVQINMRAGHMPPPEDNGTHYLKIPLNLF
ncbi:MBL fold metallo-hydrolase [Marinobacterium rhizophilum]|uniref:MBL fold metallo-hydrolase n=1 Tax=Marinobacterium rhizophilum TaxID=420402 RepID=UPI00035FF5FD|nr:MBL fold metallo-hydrolase [Marinobacterium rhizophilum]